MSCELSRLILQRCLETGALGDDDLKHLQSCTDCLTRVSARAAGKPRILGTVVAISLTAIAAVAIGMFFGKMGNQAGGPSPQAEHSKAKDVDIRPALSHLHEDVETIARKIDQLHSSSPSRSLDPNKNERLFRLTHIGTRIMELVASMQMMKGLSEYQKAVASKSPAILEVTAEVATRLQTDQSTIHDEEMVFMGHLFRLDLAAQDREVHSAVDTAIYWPARLDEQQYQRIRKALGF